MDRQTLKSIDAARYQKQLEDVIFDDFETILNVRKGHSIDAHIGLSDSDMLNRLVREEKQGVSTFYNYEDFQANLQDALYFKAKDVAAWITSEHIDFKNSRDYHEYAFTVDIEDNLVGHGYDKNFRELQTSAIKIVLQRDFSEESPFGFFVKTAYADISHENAVETGRQYTPEQILNGVVDFTSNVERAYFGLRNDFPDLKMSFTRKSSGDLLKVTVSREDCFDAVFVSQDGVKTKTYNDDGAHRLSYAECVLTKPDVAKIKDAADDYLKGYIQNQTIGRHKDYER